MQCGACIERRGSRRRSRFRWDRVIRSRWHAPSRPRSAYRSLPSDSSPGSNRPRQSSAPVMPTWWRSRGGCSTTRAGHGTPRLISVRASKRLRNIYDRNRADTPVCWKSHRRTALRLRRDSSPGGVNLRSPLRRQPHAARPDQARIGRLETPDRAADGPFHGAGAPFPRALAAANCLVVEFGIWSAPWVMARFAGTVHDRQHAARSQ